MHHLRIAFTQRDESRFKNCARLPSDSFSFPTALQSRTEPWIARVRREACTGRALTWTSLETATTKAIESSCRPSRHGQRYRFGDNGEIALAVERVWNGDETDYGLNFTTLPQVLRVKLATY